MKKKLGNMTHAEWLRHNERLERKQKISRQNYMGAKLRFIDAQAEKKKIYRRSTARLISRMCNPLLTLFHGTYIQKARCRIVCHTSIGTKVILQRNRRNGEFKVINQKFENLTLEQTQIEWKECLETFKRIFPEREIKEIETLPHCKNIKSTFKRIEFTPMGGKTQSIEANSYLPFYEDKGKDSIGFDVQPNFQKTDKCIESQKENKSLPNAKSFHYIHSNGKAKTFKVINKI